jgi:hypothetical protein
MAGAASPGDIPAELDRLLDDREVRARLAKTRSSFLARYGIVASGRAADRAAEAILTCADAGGRSAAGRPLPV